jgi:hypothetical protein
VGVPHPIRSADLRLQAHEPPVQLLSDRVGRDRLLQRLQRALEIAGGLAKLGQGGQGVDGPPSGVFAGDLHPGVRGAVQEGAAVGLAGLGERKIGEVPGAVQAAPSSSIVGSSTPPHAS